MEQTLEEKVEAALNQIRPFLHKDGGDVEVLKITKDKELILQFTGTCESCKMNMITMKTGIEDTIYREVPEITKVKAVNEIPIS
tara:strand:+ start:3544 stop:3795 length:252 start_codon:yes stop_codon:yes gene_type:complete